MPQTADYTDISRWAVVFKAFADPTRLKAALTIADAAVSVQEVAQSLSTTEQNASSHLRMLKTAGVARCTRKGKMVYYQLSPRAVPIIAQVQAFTMGS